MWFPRTCTLRRSDRREDSRSGRKRSHCCHFSLRARTSRSLRGDGARARDIIARTHHALALVHACARAEYSSSQALSPGYLRRVHGTVQQRLQSFQTGMLILPGYVICKILYGGSRACTVSLTAGTRVRPRDETFGISVHRGRHRWHLALIALST